MNILLSNVFYDPNSPWYYVIGVIFLVLIFGALTAYILLSKKFAKNKENAEKEPTETGGDEATPANADTDSTADAGAEPTDDVADSPSDQ